MVGRLFICCLMFSMNVAAQENKPALMDLIHQVQQYLDSAAKRKVDARYIEVPAKPWRVILCYKETAFDVDYSNSAGYPAAGDGVDWQLGFKPPTSPSVGIWAGYRGTGVSYAKSLRKKEGTITEGRFFCYRAVITKEPSPCMFKQMPRVARLVVVGAEHLCRHRLTKAAAA